ncbi:MAG: glycosyltransferase family 2 protein, partial [Candidatus Kerfeldbacteria bacterium]|nr:glycosyltransferase family 2 protein [Candidatus Kerfeldbacteria bacterium]
MKPHVSIIIVNWNGAADTLHCLASLQAITYPNYSIILVDNGSRPDDRTALQPLHPQVQYIQNERNLGFVGGNNIGINAALSSATPPDYLLLLNNDTTVAPDFLEAMVDQAAADSLIAIVGPKILLMDRPTVLQTVGDQLNRQTGRMLSPAEGRVDTGQYNIPSFPDFVTGACLLIKTEVVKKIGLLDNAFFAYW